jgi:hypothetical protein
MSSILLFKASGICGRTEIYLRLALPSTGVAEDISIIDLLHSKPTSNWLDLLGACMTR